MELKKNLFKPLVNTKFTITFDSENKYDVELIKMIEHDALPSLGLEPFTLIFMGDVKEKIFYEGNYLVSSEATGEIPLYLIPRHPDKEGIYYDAIIQS